jgi:hypothetical protein
MRTEDDLREALVSPPDPERAARVITTIVAETGTPVHRRRPALVGLAAAVVLAVAVGIGLVNQPRDAVPTDPATPSPFPTSTSTPVTNERVAGNWRLTHRVDLPPGWTVRGHSVDGTSESTSLRAPGHSDEHPRACGVTVWGVGERPVRDPSTKGRKAVTVNGRPGYTQVTTLGPHRESEVTWEYRDDAWAWVNCSIIDDFVTVRDIAERVVFEPVTMQVPLRLTWIPDGFRVVSASELDFAGGLRGGWTMWQRDVDGFAIQVDSSPKTQYDLKPGQPGTTTDVIAGYPAVLQAEWHRIQLDAGAYTINLTADGYQNGQTEWAPGRRELLERLAETLVPAADLGDRNTWFEAQTALPR